jgi:hypothetical protein
MDRFTVAHNGAGATAAGFSDNGSDNSIELSALFRFYMD